MHISQFRTSFLVLSLSSITLPALLSQQTPSVKLVHSVDLPGYSGDFDHFAVDYDRNRLLLAAEDHGTLEVFDLKTSVALTPGSDTSKYDAAANVLYVVTGGKDVEMKTANLEAINPDTGAKLGSITFQDNHVEAMAFVEGDPRLFINLTQTNKIAVVNRKTFRLIATWTVTPAKQNAMVAFDPAQHRLYVVCRDPGMVVVMNSDTGAVVGTLPAPLRSDEVQYDPGTHRLYVPGGEGYMNIYDTTDVDHLKLFEKVDTAPGAKTGLLVPPLHRLFLAVSPGESKATAKVLTYEVD